MEWRLKRMTFDWLVYELRHRLEHLTQNRNARGIRDWINEHPLGMGVLAALPPLVLVWVLVLVSRPASPPAFKEGSQAWFFDQNTQELFVGSSKYTGPLAAPSGPLPNGNPAGLRARVYSYELNPDESALFVGFLERPDPNAPFSASAADMTELTQWAQARLVKRVDDEKWVPATSPAGQAILQALTHPNDKGQTPIYQTPK